MGETRPEIWILGSSDFGAQVAAWFGLPFCFAHFITEGRGADQAMALYREGFRPSAAHPVPHGGLCVWAVTAETQAEAERLFLSRAVSRMNRDKGIYAALPSPEEAAAQIVTEGDRARVDRIRSRAIFGTPDVVGAKLRALAAEHQVDEIAVLSTVHDPEARRRSYALLAAEFGMPTA